MKSSSKAPAKMNKPAKILKDGYGAHWHSVGWLAAIAIVLSASTMTLSASAQSTSVTPSTLLRGINEIKVQLSRVEAKIDRLGAQSAPANTRTEAPPTTDTANRDAVTAPVKEVLSDVTRCRQACEDDFNACATNVKTDTGYLACKTNYEGCFNTCSSQ